MGKMRIVLEIDDEAKDEILEEIKKLESKGLRIVGNNKNKQYGEKYIEENWKELISKALSNLDDSYYKSEQYKLERAQDHIEREKI